jgi:sec-independent protein translocase protein TatA
MLGLGPPELIIIALVILALFGYKKLPDAARAIGRSARIFKAETKGLRDDPAPRDLESKAEAQYVRETPPPATPPPPAAASPTPAPSATPEPSPTPAASPAPSPSATPAPPAAPVPPQSETH